MKYWKEPEPHLKNTDKINVIHLTIVFHLTLYDRTHISPNVVFSFLDQDIALITILIANVACFTHFVMLTL